MNLYDWLTPGQWRLCLLASLFVVWLYLLWRAGKHMGDDGP